MTVIVQNTALTNTFDFWRNRTNDAAAAISTVVVTTNSNTTSGNAVVNGTFQSVALVANSIGGSTTINANGVVGAAANLYFSTNTIFQANAYFGVVTFGNTTINGTLGVSLNANVGGSLGVTGTTTLTVLNTGNTSITGSLTTTANANFGAFANVDATSGQYHGTWAGANVAVNRGGTGTNLAPTAGKVLIGNDDGSYSVNNITGTKDANNVGVIVSNSNGHIDVQANVVTYFGSNTTNHRSGVVILSATDVSEALGYTPAGTTNSIFGAVANDTFYAQGNLTVGDSVGSPFGKIHAVSKVGETGFLFYGENTNTASNAYNAIIRLSVANNDANSALNFRRTNNTGVVGSVYYKHSALGTTDNMGFVVASQERFTISGAANRWGFGNTNPSPNDGGSGLHVTGASVGVTLDNNANGTVILGTDPLFAPFNVSRQYGGFGIFSDSGNVGIVYTAMDSTADILVYTGGQLRWKAAANGNIGIGQSAPTRKLDVNGTFNAGNSTLGTLSAGNTSIVGTLGAGNTTVSGTLGAGNTTISGSVTGGLGAFQNTTIKSLTLNSYFTIDTVGLGHQSTLIFNSNGVPKWEIGRDTDDSFYIWNDTLNNFVYQVANTGVDSTFTVPVNFNGASRFNAVTTFAANIAGATGLTITSNVAVLGTLGAGNTTITGTLGAGNTTITGTLGAGNTTINGSVTAGLGFFQNTVVKSAAANTIVVIDAPTTGKISEIDFASNAAIKWSVGRDIDDSFYIYDNIAALERLAISNTGNITVVGNTTITGTVVSRQIYSQSVGASNELNIDTGATGGIAGINFNSNAVPKWSIGKDTDDSYFVYDDLIGDYAFQILQAHAGAKFKSPLSVLNANLFLSFTPTANVGLGNAAVASIYRSLDIGAGGTNFDDLKVIHKRIGTTNAGAWNDYSYRIQRNVDSTAAGYIAFRETNGVSLGINDTSYLDVTTGVVTISANVAGSVIAAASDYRGTTSNTKIVTPKTVADASLPLVTNWTGAVTWDMSANWNITATLTGNVTLTCSSVNAVPGRTYNLVLKQDGTGNRTITWPSSFSFLTGSNAITAAAGNWSMARIYCMTNAGGVDFIVQIIK